LADYQKMEYGKWVLKQIGQIVLLVNQIMFNKRIVGCLNSERPTEALKEYCNDLVESINIAASLISKSLPSHKVLTIEALLTIEVHSRDILDGLIEQKVTKIKNKRIFY
jgi:dynein heavy chain